MWERERESTCVCIELARSWWASSIHTLWGAVGGSKKVSGTLVLQLMRKGHVRCRVCVYLCVWCCVTCVYWYICVYSQAIAIAVCEGRFGELHHSGAAFPDDFGGAAQQLLGFGERLSQLFFPLHELGVTLQTGNENFKGSAVVGGAGRGACYGPTSHCSTNCFPPLIRSRMHFLSLICVSSTVTICSIVSRFCCGQNWSQISQSDWEWCMVAELGTTGGPTLETVFG